jgi:hypothetical protein
MLQMLPPAAYKQPEQRLAGRDPGERADVEKPVNSKKIIDFQYDFSIIATGNRQQATGNRQQATGNRQQATGNRQQATGRHLTHWRSAPLLAPHHSSRFSSRRISQSSLGVRHLSFTPLNLQLKETCAQNGFPLWAHVFFRRTLLCIFSQYTCPGSSGRRVYLPQPSDKEKPR